MRAFGKVALGAFTLGMGILLALVGYAYTAHVPAFRLHNGWFILGVMLILTAVQICLASILAEILIRVHYAQGDRRVYRARREWNASNLDG